MNSRVVSQITRGWPTSDGGGVRLTRLITPQQGLDPFLMLDEFDSSEASDYLAGFPAHPHRGFETVTYMLDGHMLHEDHLGNRGDLKPGAVQWMTAGRGIIHSEMPQQVAGRMRGFQLWINLPGVEKMKPADYRDIDPEEIPEHVLSDASIKVIAGQCQIVGSDTLIAGAHLGGATEPLYLDVALSANATLTLATPKTHRVLAYTFEGAVGVGEQIIQKGQLAQFTEGNSVCVTAGPLPARVLIIGGKPLREPVVHYGPFVMNTAAEIEQAVRDFRSGHLTA
jgi:hypothetical protein